MAKTITVDGIDLYELRVVPDAAGNLTVHAVFGRLSGSQVAATVSDHALNIL